jgi:cyclophilin family peptidyl-prolyl cis-trans isomerase
MARSQALDSAGSQFFVCLSNNESVQALDSLAGGYAAFGKVTTGMDVADTIRVGDRIESVEVVSTSAHAEAARSAAKAARIAG